MGSKNRKSRMSQSSISKAEQLFNQLDKDGDGHVTKQEAKEFFSKKSKINAVSAEAMFQEVDDDRNEKITKVEFMSFWEQVRKSGYSNDDIEAELESMLQGSAWVDWKDE